MNIIQPATFTGSVWRDTILTIKQEILLLCFLFSVLAETSDQNATEVGW